MRAPVAWAVTEKFLAGWFEISPSSSNTALSVPIGRNSSNIPLMIRGLRCYARTEFGMTNAREHVLGAVKTVAVAWYVRQLELVESGAMTTCQTLAKTQCTLHICAGTAQRPNLSLFIRHPRRFTYWMILIKSVTSFLQLRNTHICTSPIKERYCSTF